MFNAEANLAGAVQTYLNGGYTIEEICSEYNISLEEINTILNPPKIEANQDNKLEENLPNVN